MADRELTQAEITANVQKTVAEAVAASVTADAARVTAEADAKKHKAEARKADAEAQEVEHRLVKARFDADRELEKRQEELAANKHHKIYLFNSGVDSGSVKKCIDQLSQWERSEPEPLNIELQINSPGGDIVEGFALIDFIEGMKDRGHVVDAVAYGMAASMGGVLLQVGTERAMGRNAVLLIHEAQFGAVGSYGEIQDRTKLVDLFHERILKLFVDRGNVTKNFIVKHWTRTDWWIPSDLAQKYGFVDSVR